MKVVIIGGGIAGLTMGIALRKKNIETVVFERSKDVGNRGHGFLMHTDSLTILEDLAQGSGSGIPYSSVCNYSLRRPSGEEAGQLQLDSWCCIKRVDLIHFLYALLPAGNIIQGKAFARFIYKNGFIAAAEFADGHVEYGDVFVGADGKNSMVRDLLFGKVAFTQVRVKEVVGICPVPDNNIHARTFLKYQSNETGLAIGLIPVSDSEQVWFMQYDADKADVYDSTPEELEVFCKTQLKDFPAEVQHILNHNDFSTSYIWNTSDFDLLPAFHKHNAVLIGDAAHVALPFTSAGTTNAIIDAVTLSSILQTCTDLQDAFSSYYSQRADAIQQHVLLGRELKEKFLFPQDHLGEEPPLPLIGENPKSAKIKLRYFTDPVCSTCWVMQPFLRKLEMEYGTYLDIEYYMGGMLESWDVEQKGSIKMPADAAAHWDEVAEKYGMPLDGDVWLEDPMNSSYPPSIAFKAAQLQDNYKAKLLLRRLQEMVFIEKKNIVKRENIAEAATDAALDSVKLLKDFDEQGKQLFDADLRIAKQYAITTFPTLHFTNSAGVTGVLKGFQSYERLEEMILRLSPGAQKEITDTAPQKLFTLFAAMTTKEFALISNNSAEQTQAILNRLYTDGRITRYESKNGVIWRGRK